MLFRLRSRSGAVYLLWRLDGSYTSQLDFDDQVWIHFALNDRQLVFARVTKGLESPDDGPYIVGRVAGADANTKALLVTLDLVIHADREVDSLQYDENLTKFITVEFLTNGQGRLEYQRIKSVRAVDRTPVMWK